MPVAVMTRGTIIGDISRLVMKLRNGISGRDRPKAAKVPMEVARAVEQRAYQNEFLMARIHVAFSHISCHQFSVPSGAVMPKRAMSAYQRNE